MGPVGLAEMNSTWTRLAVADVGAGVAVLALVEHLGQGVVQPAVVEPEVDEAGTGHLDGDDVVGQAALQDLRRWTAARARGWCRPAWP